MDGKSIKIAKRKIAEIIKSSKLWQNKVFTTARAVN
jgi:hypothetical protein